LTQEGRALDSTRMTTSAPLVLVADDEPSMLELVARHLRTMSDPKLEVIQASDGEEAWRLAREHLPDLVVLDVMMPGMSGWEVCRKIREDIALAHTGVVMLTGIGENLNQMTSPLYGADAYIDKPFEFEDFDDKVRDTLHSREGQRLGVVRPSINGTAGAAKPAIAGTSAAARPKAKKSAPPKAEKKAKAPAAAKAGKKAAAKAGKKAAAKAGKKSAKPAAALKSKAKPAKKTASKAPKKAAPKKASPKKASSPKKAAPKKKATTKKKAGAKKK
jgi:DNA-binding response OmpR family regulator